MITEATTNASGRQDASPGSTGALGAPRGREVRIFLPFGILAFIGAFGSLAVCYTSIVVAAVIGGAVNIASCLCDKAPDGAVLLSQRAYRDVEHQMRAESVGMFDLKGISSQVEAYNVLALGGARALRPGNRSLAPPVFRSAAAIE